LKRKPTEGSSMSFAAWSYSSTASLREANAAKT
jgi:hypothetical protein